MALNKHTKKALVDEFNLVIKHLDLLEAAAEDALDELRNEADEEDDVSDEESALEELVTECNKAADAFDAVIGDFL